MTKNIYHVHKKILLISDIITVFSGGIEMYIFNVAQVLRKEGYTVKLFGIQRKRDLVKKRRSYLLPLGGFNIISTLELVRIHIVFDPDIIWFHSVSRYHGRLPIITSNIFKSQKLMMYHDLGYFHPFPSLVTQEEQVLSWSFKNFIKMATEAKGQKDHIAKKFVLYIVVTLKFWSIQLLRLSLLRTIDKHLVPSDFMVTYLKQRGINEEKIEVLPHFIVSEIDNR